jgi:hypothetical protein
MKRIALSDGRVIDDRRTNGNGMKLLWWVLGGMGSLLMIGGVSWMSTIYAQGEENASTILIHNTQIVSMQQTLQRIEGKLDHVIEREIKTSKR